MDPASNTADLQPTPHPLTARQQRRNVLIYAANWALIYLASPVTYVGLVQATLLDRLGFASREANLPAGVYLWTTPLAVAVVWLFPRAGQLKPLLAAAFLVTAALGAFVTLAILYLSAGVILAALVAHAAFWGCANGVAATCQWEMLGRGVAESRRGQALGLAFGAGPVLAVVASLGSQYLLAAQPRELPLGLVLPAVSYPWNFALLYGLSVPILLLAATQSSLFVVPLPPAEPPRPDFGAGVFGGFGEFLGHRLTLLAALAYVLVYAGHMVYPNIALYTRQALSEAPEAYAGLQLTLRFGFKIVAGFFLGWLLTRTDPRALMLVTAGLTTAGVVWALAVPGVGFLVAFGILGAGELFGVYYPNYILGCSPAAHMRRNMAFTSLITMPVGFAPVLFGWVADVWGPEDKAFGFRVSFLVALAVLAAAFLVVQRLPAWPRPAQGRSQAEPATEKVRPDTATSVSKRGIV
jgi:hypothetical protein